MKTMTAMAALAAICMSMPAMAAMDKGDMQKKTDYWFNKMDTNQDGSISKSEHEQFGADMFSAADKNGDGQLSKDEVAAQKKADHMEMKNAMGKSAMK